MSTEVGGYQKTAGMGCQFRLPVAYDAGETRDPKFECTVVATTILLDLFAREY
jgi:hypothetical protein